ncbi:MAG: cell division protein FtsA [Deltaproteobacteria bacterium]|jgi:cell division protein FtsA|nr:cell division protein FtsA [Deltaproteobacteria bacterium]MBW1957150.1 cell division protein FtsA [Deltaproteobacteria bacterium]MBW2012598.1 cell division protein FtsA [Deltaproteobacteria bacterium]MBW2087791.1 cell division protein FtsA [Deltaproteobacteria bacterium]MBW2320988.1 cell division protein FtsA [Deltaproteobacteria bacterium]
MQRQENIIVGLDVGTTKICAVVGEVEGNKINIIGIGTHPSIGLRKGVVVNIESTVESIQKAVEEAELMAGCEISSVYAGIAGGHITGFNSRGIVAIKGPEVTKNDVERVIDAARAVAIPMDREVIHVIPQEFIIDDQGGIQNPVGMSGVRLEAKIHIVTGAVTSAHNIVKCANRSGLDVCDIVLEPLASGEAVLTNEEKDVGTALLDLGGGTSDLAIFFGKNIKHTFVLSLGGNNLTNDISVGLRASQAEAEKIKIKYGTCVARDISNQETIEVPGMGGRKPRKLPRQILGEILEPRMEEIFTLIKREIFRAGMDNVITSGLVLTGGSSLLHGITDIAESIFDVPSRLGKPRGIRGLIDVVNNPMYATGVGLVLYGAKHQPEKKFRIRDSNIFHRVMTRMKRWFKDVI